MEATAAQAVTVIPAASGTALTLPPVLAGSLTPEIRSRVEHFYLSPYEIVERWVNRPKKRRHPPLLPGRRSVLRPAPPDCLAARGASAPGHFGGRRANLPRSPGRHRRAQNQSPGFDAVLLL